MTNHHTAMRSRAAKKGRLEKNLLVFALANLTWVIFRTGTKPSRVVYPCQRAALANSSILLSVSCSLSLAPILTRTEKFVSKRGGSLALLVIIAAAVVSCEQVWRSIQPDGAVNPNQEIQLVLEARGATAFPESSIYVVNGRVHAHVSQLINLMGLHGLLFYKSDIDGANQGPAGLIARDDVVLIKINCQWEYRGGTSTDVLKELIQVIIDHPDGFVGEIVVADNGQMYGSMDYAEGNAEDITQSTQDVVDMFSPNHNISTYEWRFIRATQVDEYSEGNMTDGYVLYDTADPETGIYVSYPKFRTQYGTHISFKHGIWNGTGYERRLKVINLPVLKSHKSYGVTASLKHYMGVQSEGERPYSGGLANGHYSVATGGMGTLMVETGLPTLNIVDAIWINANPPPSASAGPQTPYDLATRVNLLMACTDPVALDYWAAKHVLMQAASLVGYNDTHALDPDNTDKSGVMEEAFGVWLNLTRNGIAAGGYNVTTDEDHMNVFIYPYVHDIAVINVAPFETVVAPGHLLNITVTTENQGDFNENFNVTVSANTTAVETKAVTLPTKDSTTTVFTWNTTSWNEGNYTISAHSMPIQDENDIADNTYVDGCVEVKAIHDIAVISVSTYPVTVTEGQAVDITVVVKNQGSFSETFNVTSFSSGRVVGTKTLVGLGAATSQTLLFIWNTTGVSAGDYVIKVIASNVTEEVDTSDNTFVDGIVVVSAAYVHDVTVVEIAPITTEVYVGQILDVFVLVRNDGNAIETFNVTIWCDGSLIERQIVSDLAPTANATLTFAWDTTGVPPGTYTIIAAADTVPDEADTADNVRTDGIVWVEGDSTPPNIGMPSQNPLGSNLMAYQEVKVSANVTDAECMVKNVTLFYTTDNGTTWKSRTMNCNVSTGLYEATIPGQQAGTRVRYKIVAYDDVGNRATKDGMDLYFVNGVGVYPELPLVVVLALLIVAALAVILKVRRRRARIGIKARRL